MHLSHFAQVPLGAHTLPPLPYPYNALEPAIDDVTLKIHHDKLHKGIVDALNKTELQLVEVRKKGNYDDIEYYERQLAFLGSGHILHSIYWTNMTYPGAGGTPSEYLMRFINFSFGSLKAFKDQFLAATKNVEASGFGILGYNPAFGRLEILQCGNFENLTQWGIIPILVCDVWEHSYFIKYHEKTADYVDAWWNLINWQDVKDRLIYAVEAKLPLQY
ncbi:MAG: superoxide dismutase [Lachnospiraceae bacterium]|nr:superoxide dismutase [Lachnospiraceae bacterium]